MNPDDTAKAKAMKEHLDRMNSFLDSFMEKAKGGCIREHSTIFRSMQCQQSNRYQLMAMRFAYQNPEATVMGIIVTMEGYVVFDWSNGGAVKLPDGATGDGTVIDLVKLRETAVYKAFTRGKGGQK